MKILFPVAAALAAACITTAPAVARASKTPTGFILKSLKANGAAYPYAVYVPRNYDSSKKWPLILFLHGSGESGADGLKMCQVGIGSAIQMNAEKWPFIVVFPQKPNIPDQWEVHEAAVMAMVAQARKDYNVDGSRLYLTGLSQGGHGSWVIGARHADLWAAVAPICGYGMERRADANNPPKETDADLGRALKDTPVWAFHGLADTVVDPQQTKDLVAAVEAAGGRPKATYYPGVNHDSWDKAYHDEDLGAWFLSHSRG
ncbi:MAG TPA: PHB depolymerase family esterase [Armatimonadota bacterium]|jgi:predicted peptidase